MRNRIRKIFIISLAFTIIWISKNALSQETLLHWKNGDSLPGKLIDGETGKITWSSPYFLDNLIIDINVLDSITFNKQTEKTTETFRVSTELGDVWIADIIGADENTITFNSKRFGTFTVDRNIIYSLENREQTNIVFDGSLLKAWQPSTNEINNRALKNVNNIHVDWYPELGGHPHTDKAKANIFQQIEWPKRFEIDLEVSSTTRPPGFVFAFGKNLYEELRVETWVNELVVVQGTLFESIMKIETERRNFRLRLAYDQEHETLKVFDLNGNILLDLNNVNPPLKHSGPYIYNRGNELTVKRLRVYRQPAEFSTTHTDYSKPRIHMMNGDVFYGKLFVNTNESFVKAPDGIQTEIDLKQVDRVVNPGRTLRKTEEFMALTYVDGSVVHGHVVELNSDSVVMQTTFSAQPITCSLAGVSLLRFESESTPQKIIQDYDKMFFPSGRLRGHLYLESGNTPAIRWLSIGVITPVRFANDHSLRVERNSKRVSRLQSYDVKSFPHLLHLKNGEVIPCELQTLDKDSIKLRSPFISAKSIKKEYIKAYEFTRGKTHGRKENRNPITITGGDKHRIILEDGRILEAIMQRREDGNVHITVDSDKLDEEFKFIRGEIVIVAGDFAKNDAAALKHGVELLFDPLDIQAEKLDEKMERALTVPRFDRENPPTHILVANNGDLMRGKLISFNKEHIQFESKLKKSSIPINRVARIIDVSNINLEQSVDNNIAEEGSDNKLIPLTDDVSEQTPNLSSLRFALIHNPIMIFEFAGVKGETLQGRSNIYGEVSIPIKSVQYIHFGEKAQSFQSVFEKWVIKAAEEPDYGEDR